MFNLFKQLKKLLIWCLLEPSRNRTGSQGVQSQWIGAAIAGVAAIVGALLSSKSNKNANQQTLDYNREAYNTERKDALTDYQTQTEYNNPSSQMARLREAGLNPMLAAGNISSNSPAVRSSNHNSYDAKPVDIGPGIDSLGENLGGALGQYLDMRLKRQTLDNLKQQNTVTVQDALLRQAQTELTLANIPKSQAETQKIGLEQDKISTDIGATQFDLSQRQRLADISAQAAEANLARTKAETQIMFNRNEREAAQNSSSLKEAAARILRMSYENAKSLDEREEIKARIQMLGTDTRLKTLDENLKKAGIQPHDNMFMRYLQMYLNDAGISSGGSFKEGATRFKNRIDSTISGGWNKFKNKKSMYFLR